MHSIVITKDHGPLSVKDLPRHMTGNENEELFFPDDGINYERPSRTSWPTSNAASSARLSRCTAPSKKVAEVFKVNRSTIFRKLHSEKDGGIEHWGGRGNFLRKFPPPNPPSSSKTFISGTEYDFGIVGLSLGGSFPETPFPTHHGGDMKRCRITVLKRHFDEELAKEYGSKGIGKCPMLKEGQIFYADYAKPDGFCDEAWKAIYQYVFALAHGSGQFYYGDWIEKPGVAICSCNDGLRPVIFKVERTDEEATINYTPNHD